MVMVFQNSHALIFQFVYLYDALDFASAVSSSALIDQRNWGFSAETALSNFTLFQSRGQNALQAESLAPSGIRLLHH